MKITFMGTPDFAVPALKKIHEVSKKGISIVENNISKNQLIQQLKSVPKKAGYKISQEKRIILVFRYFYKNTLIKEIIINPEDFN